MSCGCGRNTVRLTVTVEQRNGPSHHRSVYIRLHTYNCFFLKPKTLALSGTYPSDDIVLNAWFQIQFIEKTSSRKTSRCLGAAPGGVCATRQAARETGGPARMAREGASNRDSAPACTLPVAMAMLGTTPCTPRAAITCTHLPSQIQVEPSQMYYLRYRLNPPSADHFPGVRVCTQVPGCRPYPPRGH